MSRFLLPGGLLGALVGVALLVPVFVAWRATGGLSPLGTGVFLLGGLLVPGGVAAAMLGVRAPHSLSAPVSVKAALCGNGLFLALFALEISDGLVRRGGAIHPLSTLAFGPALLLFCGQVAGRGWAWMAARVVALLFVLWFLAGSALVCVAQPHDEQGPVSVWVRAWMVGVGLALAGVLAAGFVALGRPSARRYFGRECPA